MNHDLKVKDSPKVRRASTKNWLDPIVSEFLSYIEIERRFSQNTVQAYKHDLSMMRSFLIRSASLKEIRTQQIRLGLAKMQEKRKWKSKSLGRRICTLRSFFQFCLEEGYIKASPMQLIRTPKQEKRLPVFLTVEELKRLLDAPDTKAFQGYRGKAWRGKRDKAIFTLLAMTGIRIAELVSLNLTDIVHKTMRVFGKGAKERMIPLNTIAIQALEEYLAMRPLTNNPALFLSWHCTRFQSHSIQEIIRNYAIKAGITRIRVSPHKLRHTFATLLYERGNDILKIQQLLGHASVATTQIYTHTSTKHLKDAVASLNSI